MILPPLVFPGLTHCRLQALPANITLVGVSDIEKHASLQQKGLWRFPLTSMIITLQLQLNISSIFSLIFSFFFMKKSPKFPHLIFTLFIHF